MNSIAQYKRIHTYISTNNRQPRRQYRPRHKKKKEKAARLKYASWLVRAHCNECEYLSVVSLSTHRENYEKRQSKPEAFTAATAAAAAAEKKNEKIGSKNLNYLCFLLYRSMCILCVVYGTQEVSVAAATTAAVAAAAACWCLYINVRAYCIATVHISSIGRLSFHFDFFFISFSVLMFSFSRHFGDSRILSIRVEKNA